VVTDVYVKFNYDRLSIDKILRNNNKNNKNNNNKNNNNNNKQHLSNTLEIWQEPDLAGFPKYGRIPDLPEPEQKCGTTLVILAAHLSHSTAFIDK